MFLKILTFLFVTALAATANEHFDTLKVKNDIYTNVTVTTISATDIFFTYPGGMSNAKLKDLDSTLQKHFSYNANKAAKVEQAHVQGNAQYVNQLLHAQPTPQSAADYTRQPEPNVPEGLALGQKFPGFSESDVAGKPLSVSAYSGKVLLIDFWATWCGPCKAELPNVIATYQKYHPQGFEIIGVSLDEDQNALTSFTQQQGMPWQQYFDGKGWNNKLTKQYGVNSIPMDYLLDPHGIIIGKELRGEALGDAVMKAVMNN
jgi:thiol-disulfide isomerase/thioredoxin